MSSPIFVCFVGFLGGDGGNSRYPNRCKVVSHCDVHFPYDYYAEKLFMSLLAIHIFFGEMSNVKRPMYFLPEIQPLHVDT